GVDIEKITRAVLLEQFKVKGANEGFTISGNPEGDSLEITPWVFLRVLDNGQVLPWTVWNVQCMDLYWNKKKWEGVCFSSLARPRPLDGKGGWTSNNGEFLKQALEADARKLLELENKI